jgi:hypothetical protein
MHPEADAYGLAHICLVPLILLAISLLAAGFDDLPRWLRLAVVTGAAVDFALGIFLHIHLQSLEFQTAQTGPEQWAIDPALGLGLNAMDNFMLKKRHSLLFLGDYLAAWSCLLESVLVSLFLAGILYLLRRVLVLPAGQRQDNSKVSAPKSNGKK